MRPALALLLSVLLLSGVYAYTQFAESVRRPPLQITPKFAGGDYSVQIDRTFDCIGDEDWEDVASLVVKFRGVEILRRTDTISARELILIDPLENVEQMENEIYVFANATKAETVEDDWGDESTPENREQAVHAADNDVTTQSTNQALRIVVRSGDAPLAETTFWLEPGAMAIQGSMSFAVPAEVVSSERNGN